MDTEFCSDLGGRNPVTDPNLDQDPPRQRVSDGLCKRSWDDLKEIDCGQDTKEQ